MKVFLNCNKPTFCNNPNATQPQIPGGGEGGKGDKGGKQLAKIQETLPQDTIQLNSQTLNPINKTCVNCVKK
jgi:hypothetical protein